jgi:hypothetical protein
MDGFSGTQQYFYRLSRTCMNVYFPSNESILKASVLKIETQYLVLSACRE